MAFIDQVQDLTSLTVSSVSSNSELSQFLSDGVIDVTNRWLAIKPGDVELFAAVTTEQTSNGVDLHGARIISVIRENGVNNQWRSCRKIAASNQYDVTDKESLEYASSTNPAYMIDENGLISVFPTPGADPNAFKVYYVNNIPQDDGGAALAHDDTTIKYFPNDKIYLVIMYAGLRLIQTQLGYTGPSVAGTASELTNITQLDAENTIDDYNGNAIEVDQWFATAAHLIEDEEDIELASAHLQKIGAYINSYNSAMQNNLNETQVMQARYAILSQVYDSAFGIAAPKGN